MIDKIGRLMVQMEENRCKAKMLREKRRPTTPNTTQLTPLSLSNSDLISVIIKKERIKIPFEKFIHAMQAGNRVREMKCRSENENKIGME